MNIDLKTSFVREILSGVSYTLFGSAISQSIIFLSAIPLSATLGESSYGGFGVIQNNVALITLLATALLSLTAQKYVAQFKNHGLEYRFGIINKLLSFGKVISVIFFLAAILFFSIYNEKLRESNALILILISSIIVLLNSFNCVQIGILAGLGNFKQVSFINILKGTTSGLLMVILVYPYDLLGAVVGLAIGSGASCLLATIFINKVMTPLYKANIGNSIVFKLKDFSGIAIPSILSSLITIPVMMLANTKLATGENGLKEMGIFNIAFQWRTIMIFVPTYLNFVFLSHLSTSFYSNLKRFKQLLILNFGATLLLCSFFLLIIIFFKSQIEFIYIVDFRGVSDVILLLSISALFTAIASVLGNLFAATTKMWYGFIPNALWTLVFLYLLNTSEKIDALELSYIYMKSYLLLVISASIFASILYFNMRKTLLK